MLGITELPAGIYVVTNVSINYQVFQATTRFAQRVYWRVHVRVPVCARA